MSGLAQLEARIATLRWAADWLGTYGTGDPETDLRAVALTLESAVDMVRVDYGLQEEPSPEPEEPAAEPEAAPAVDDLPAAVDADGMPPDDDERPPPAIPTPPAVIREWAQKQGIQCPPRGVLPAALISDINERRRLMRLPPFVQKRPAEELAA